MFESVEMAPPDPILGLGEAFNKDARSGKINLSIGVYKDAAGQTPVLQCVKEAERRLLEQEKTKGYKPIEGDSAYGKLVQDVLLGAGHALIAAGRVRTAQTPGGTGALRVAADFLKANLPATTVWISDPTWPNHPSIFKTAGLKVASYPYFDAKANTLDFAAMLAKLEQAAPGDAILLHACCHNPTGADPSLEQWKRIAQVLAQRRLLPLIDFAYQGFGDGLDSDAAGLREIAQACPELVVCSSFSKNFGLYNERVGALTMVAQDATAAERVLSQVKVSIRSNYSNPPAHGGAIVTTILSDASLRQQWLGELAAMRERIHQMRSLFARELDQRGIKLSAAGNGFIAQQRGMFSFSGLGKEQVARLRDEHAIYIVGSGRVNVAGMTPQNIPLLCDAIAKVL